MHKQTTRPFLSMKRESLSQSMQAEALGFVEAEHV